MRLVIPERVKTTHIAIAASVVLIVQLLEQTEPVFAMLTFAYILIFGFAYNAAGGIYFPSGAWIFFTATETALIGITYKLFLIEPGQTNLNEPVQTMLVYCVGLAVMGLMAWFSRRLRPEKGLLAGISAGEQLFQAAAGCFFFGIYSSILSSNATNETATASSAFAQLNHFIQLAIILGTVYQIRKSGGRRSTNWVVWASGFYLFSLGIVNFSKEAMFSPIVAWLIPCLLLSFRFSKKQMLLLAAMTFFLVQYLVPYSQYGRQSRDYAASFSEQAKTAWTYLSDLGRTRKLYLQTNTDAELDEGPHFFNESQGLLDRLNMIAFDDKLIEVTDQGSVYGITPVIGGYLNAIPHFLWKDKPDFHAGNDYGREIGVIDQGDESTGISFSPTGDAYHEARWVGVLVIEPIALFILFFISDSLSGDVRKSPWGLLYIALFVHYAPEGLLPGVAYMTTTGAETVLLAVFLSGLVFPFIGRLITPRAATRGSLPRFDLPGFARRASTAAGKGTSLPG